MHYLETTIDSEVWFQVQKAICKLWSPSYKQRVLSVLIPQSYDEDWSDDTHRESPRHSICHVARVHKAHLLLPGMWGEWVYS